MVGRKTRQKLIDALSSAAKPVVTNEPLSPETRSIRTQRFTFDMRNILARFGVDERQLRQIALDEDRDIAVRFAALYGSLHLLRRRGDGAQYRQLVTEAQPSFGHIPLFETFYTFYHQFAGDLPEAFRHATRALELLPDMPGVQHLQAQIIADLVDRSVEIDDRVVAEARRRLETAVQSGTSASPAYHETLARLLLRDGAHERARQAINIALSLESPSEPGYLLRLANRRMIRSLIDHDQQQAELITRIQSAYVVLRDRHEVVQEEMSGMRGELYRVRDQSLTLLALFAAVIAFVVTTVQVSVTLEPVSVMIITLLLGLLTITIFAAASVVLGLSASRLTIGILVAALASSVTLIALAAFDVLL